MTIGSQVRFESSPGVWLTGTVKTVQTSGRIIVTVKSAWSGLSQDYVVEPHPVSQEQAL
jgi:hypothetical protein